MSNTPELSTASAAFIQAYMAACEGRAADHNEIGLHYFRAGAAFREPTALTGGAQGEAVNRGDAVNLAREMLAVRDCKGITSYGVRVLCEAVMTMDRALAATVAPEAAPAVDWEKLEALGWQRVTCPACGDFARAAPAKWCTYCRKSDHADAECWSTRVGSHDAQPAPVAMPTGFAWTKNISDLSAPAAPAVAIAAREQEKCLDCGDAVPKHACYCQAGCVHATGPASRPESPAAPAPHATVQQALTGAEKVEASVLGHLGQSNLASMTGNVDQRVSMPATEAQEEDSSLINLRLGSREHDAQATASARPHSGSPVESGDGTAPSEAAAKDDPPLHPRGWDKSPHPFVAVVQRVQKLGRVDDHHLVVQGATTVADCGIAGKAFSPQHKAWSLAIAALLNKANGTTRAALQSANPKEGASHG